MGRVKAAVIVLLVVLAGCGSGNMPPPATHQVALKTNHQGYEIIDYRNGVPRVVEKGGQ